MQGTASEDINRTGVTQMEQVQELWSFLTLALTLFPKTIAFCVSTGGAINVAGADVKKVSSPHLPVS